MTEAQIQEWVAGMLQGNQEAYRCMYEATKERVYRTVVLLIGSKQDAPDVVSEVYAELFKSIGSYRPDRPFQAWLTGIVIRQTRSWNRRLWRKFRIAQRSRDLEAMEAAPNSEEVLLRRERRLEIADFVHRLSFKLRSVIVLRYYQEQTFEEIAELLSIPVGTVKSRHHAALEKLRGYAERSVSRQVKEESAHVH
ncbi:sigma-70 family RNA polymerase sigma factor [Paenibacillus sp. y28]|uniref:sigma-70 family RNA polymerase sigma factor n=1 Tax=Paenibacillus sp. y28 TaxID=3129110 RepID=UPI003016E7CA